MMMVMMVIMFVNQVTNEDEGTRIFLEVREEVRRNAVVYKDKVLPLTEEVIRHIGSFADSFLDLDFDDWVEGLEETIKDMDKAVGFCKILSQMHLTIVEDLKRNEEKAEVGIKIMEKMALEYKEMSKELEKRAQECKESADDKRFWGNVTGVLTLGISTAVLHAQAHGDDWDAKEKMAHALAKRENAELAVRAADVTKVFIIPAVKDFIEGVEVCSTFLVCSRENLRKMRNNSEKGSKEIYFKAIKKRAQLLSRLSMRFLTRTDMMRSDLKTIPEEVVDKNYVDVWFERQKQRFLEENKSIWALIAGSTIGKSGRFHFKSFSKFLSPPM